MNDFLIKNLVFLTKDRDESGPRQAGVGVSAGVGQPAVSKIINGRTKEPGYRTVAGLAKHFQLSIDDLVNRDLGEIGPSPASQSEGLDLGKLSTVLLVVEGAIKDSRKDVPPEFKARMIKRVYESKHALTADSAGTVRALLAEFIETMGV